jgi:hypothetical protein
MVNLIARWGHNLLLAAMAVTTILVLILAR